MITRIIRKLIRRSRDLTLNTHTNPDLGRYSKLHLGCGANIIDGWLNADLIETDSVPPEAKKHLASIFIMDATKTFPFPDGPFSHIYCEDFLEHFDQKDGLSITAECFRVLKPGGVWRISTPSFDKILPRLDLTARERINLGHWNWGHKLLYTETYAATILRAAGFTPVTPCAYGASEECAFQGIDTREEQSDLNLILEATKPR